MRTMKKNNNTPEQSDKTAPVLGELEQLRQIIFGEAQQQLISQLNTMHTELTQALKTQAQNFSNRLNEMNNTIEQQFTNMDRRMVSLDKTQDEQQANLTKDISDLASEHEMLATTTQQDFKHLQQSLDSESDTLASNFHEQLEQLKAHLEDVSKELSSSKTDRKTLAKLLATMATNLEDDKL